MKKQILSIVLSILWGLAVSGVMAQDAIVDVRSMAFADGWLWGVAAGGTGVFRFEGGVWKPAPDGAGAAGSAVTSLASLRGRLYAGSAQGLSVRNGAAWDQVPLPVAGTVGVTALAADETALYIATTAGMFRLDEPGGMPKLFLGNDARAQAGGASGAAVSNVRIFPPPEAGQGSRPTSEPARTTAQQGSGDTAVTAAPDTAKEPAWWTKVKKPARPQPTFFKDILPVMVKECLPCHTDGTGKYFPLHEPQTVIRYFKNGGLVRFEQFLEDGGGMAGKVAPETAKLIHIWVVDGCRE